MRRELCELLDIRIPVIGAPFGPWEQVDLAAAVSEAGGLGSVGTAVRPLPELRRQWRRLRELTERPFAINHTTRPFDADAFAATLEFGPAAISFHLAVPPELIERAHDAGILWIQAVTDVRDAERAADAGADVIIAQGGEAGGHGGWISTFVLVPQVVDVAGEIPVVAAGGIADGRGLAAALALGAQGVSIGTRLLATEEMAIADEWKTLLVAADAADAIKVENSERILPPYTMPGTPAAPRALRTPLIDQLREEPDSVDPEATAAQVISAVLRGRGHEYMPFAGQSVGLIGGIEPAARVLGRMLSEADAALAVAASYRPQRLSTAPRQGGSSPATN